MLNSFGTDNIGNNLWAMKQKNTGLYNKNAAAIQELS
jgi:hypothetical protein